MLNKIMKNKIMKNVGWLVSDKIFVLLLQFFIGIKVVNYYGSDIYGYYSYAISLFTFFPIIIDILNVRVIKIRYSTDEKSIISIKKIYFWISMILFFIVLMFKYIISRELHIFLIILAINNIILTNSLAIELYYEYKLKTSKIVCSNIVAKILILSLQYLVISLDGNIYFLGISQILGNGIRYLFLLYFFKKDFKITLSGKINFQMIKEIMMDSKYFWIANSANMLFIQMDKIMLGNLIGVKEVAIYSIAVQLVGIIEIPMLPISNILFTNLIKTFNENNKLYLKKIKKFNTYITFLYIFVMLFSIFVVKYTFKLFYNEEYFMAIKAYNILAFGSVLKANILLRSSHLTLKKKGEILLSMNIYGMISAIILNYLFIPKYGIIGAAIATNLSRGIICIAGLYYKEGREWFIIQVESFNPKNILRN